MHPLFCFDAEATSLDITHSEQHLQLFINLFLEVFLSHYTMSMLLKIPDRGALIAFSFSCVKFNVLYDDTTENNSNGNRAGRPTYNVIHKRVTHTSESRTTRKSRHPREPINFNHLPYHQFALKMPENLSRKRVGSC